MSIKAVMAMIFAGASISQALASAPKPWQIGFQSAASPIMEKIVDMYTLLQVIITLVAILVVGLLGYVIFRFRASKNPVPSQASHNTVLEVVWTLLPVLVLVMIGIPSLKLMYFAETIKEADVTLKVIGNQWYWKYEYPDHKIEFDSTIVADNDLKPGMLRLLSVDKPVVVPVGAVVKVLVTASDVLHSFAVPSLGVKRDAVPGRINETWFQIHKEGTYYGQCSELCGKLHGFMPIEIKAVSKPEYDQWVDSHKEK